MKIYIWRRLWKLLNVMKNQVGKGSILGYSAFFTFSLYSTLNSLASINPLSPCPTRSHRQECNRYIYEALCLGVKHRTQEAHKPINYTTVPSKSTWTDLEKSWWLQKLQRWSTCLIHPFPTVRPISFSTVSRVHSTCYYNFFVFLLPDTDSLIGHDHRAGTFNRCLYQLGFTSTFTTSE